MRREWTGSTGGGAARKIAAISSSAKNTTEVPLKSPWKQALPQNHAYAKNYQRELKELKTAACIVTAPSALSTSPLAAGQTTPPAPPPLTVQSRTDPWHSTFDKNVRTQTVESLTKYLKKLPADVVEVHDIDALATATEEACFNRATSAENYAQKVERRLATLRTRVGLPSTTTAHDNSGGDNMVDATPAAPGCVDGDPFSAWSGTVRRELSVSEANAVVSVVSAVATTTRDNDGSEFPVLMLHMASGAQTSSESILCGGTLALCVQAQFKQDRRLVSDVATAEHAHQLLKQLTERDIERVKHVTPKVGEMIFAAKKVFRNFSVESKSVTCPSAFRLLAWKQMKSGMSASLATMTPMRVIVLRLPCVSKEVRYDMLAIHEILTGDASCSSQIKARIEKLGSAFCCAKEKEFEGCPTRDQVYSVLMAIVRCQRNVMQSPEPTPLTVIKTKLKSILPPMERSQPLPRETTHVGVDENEEEEEEEEFVVTKDSSQKRARKERSYKRLKHSDSTSSVSRETPSSEHTEPSSNDDSDESSDFEEHRDVHLPKKKRSYRVSVFDSMVGTDHTNSDVSPSAKKKTNFESEECDAKMTKDGGDEEEEELSSDGEESEVRIDHNSDDDDDDDDEIQEVEATEHATGFLEDDDRDFEECELKKQQPVDSTSIAFSSFGRALAQQREMWNADVKNRQKCTNKEKVPTPHDKRQLVATAPSAAPPATVVDPPGDVVVATTANATSSLSRPPPPPEKPPPPTPPSAAVTNLYSQAKAKTTRIIHTLSPGIASDIARCVGQTHRALQTGASQEIILALLAENMAMAEAVDKTNERMKGAAKGMQELHDQASAFSSTLALLTGRMNA